MSRSFETAQSMNSLNRICPPPFLSMDLNSGKGFPSNRPYSWVDELSNSDLDDWQADSDLSTQVDDSIVRLSRLYFRVDWTAKRIRVDWLTFANLRGRVRGAVARKTRRVIDWSVEWSGDTDMSVRQSRGRSDGRDNNTVHTTMLPGWDERELPSERDREREGGMRDELLIT